MKKLLFPVLVLIAFGLGVAASLLVEHQQTAPRVEGFLWPDPRALTPFELVDQDGAPFDLARLQGRWTLLFFGYTYCPDVCPATLAALAEVHSLLVAEDATRDLQVVFVSVDPQRDTPARLAEYVRYFDPVFIGATGSDEALRGLTRQLGVIAFRGEADADGNYLVDHTAALLLLDDQARLVGLFRAPHQPDDIAGRVRMIRGFVDG